MVDRLGRSRKTASGRDVIVASLKKVPAFSALEDAALFELARATVIRNYAKNQFVYTEGDSPQKYIVVLRGTLRVCKHTPDGRLLTVLEVHPYETFGNIALFHGTPLLVSLQAMRGTTIAAISKDVFRKVLLKNLDLALSTIMTLGKQVKTVTETALDLAAYPVEDRVTKVLRRLSEYHGAVIPYTKQDIADLAGASRETTCRMLGHLQTARLISTVRGAVIILDRKRLTEYKRSLL